MNTENKRDYYKVLLVGQSGKGKTFSLRNFDETSTGFINAELKPLPFKKNFKYHAKPKKLSGVLAALRDYAKNPEIKVIILDSLSSVFESLVEEARSLYTNWEIWNYYNKQVGELLKLIKEIDKEIFVTAHYEVLPIEGSAEKRVKSKGKEWEGVIEKEFTIVLYTEDRWKNDNVEYSFRLAGEGMSAKCPPEIFGTGIIRIPNDANIIYEKILEFVK